MKKATIAMIAALALLFGGCAAKNGEYTQTSVGQTKSSKRGVVLEVKNITIGDDNTGTVTGGVLGGVAGSAFGKGEGKVAAIAAGAIIGALMGESINKDAGQELTIRFDSGDIITTVYRVDKNAPFMFRSGDIVMVDSINSKVTSIRLAN